VEHEHSNLPISEQYRVVAKNWVDANAAADMLEETKSAVLSQMMSRSYASAVNAKELEVKASAEWYGYLEKMVESRKKANLLKVQLEYIRMRFSEQQSEEATKRAEMKL